MNLQWCIIVRNALEKLILRKLFEYFIASLGKSPGEGQILVHTPGAFRAGCVPCPASTSLGCASRSPGFVSSDENPPGKDIKTGKVKPMMCQEIPGPFSWRPIWSSREERKEEERFERALPLQVFLPSTPTLEALFHHLEKGMQNMYLHEAHTSTEHFFLKSVLKPSNMKAVALSGWTCKPHPRSTFHRCPDPLQPFKAAPSPAHICFALGLFGETSMLLIGSFIALLLSLNSSFSMDAQPAHTVLLKGAAEIPSLCLIYLHHKTWYRSTKAGLFLSVLLTS